MLANPTWVLKKSRFLGFALLRSDVKVGQRVGRKSALLKFCFGKEMVKEKQNGDQTGSSICWRTTRNPQKRTLWKHRKTTTKRTMMAL